MKNTLVTLLFAFTLASCSGGGSGISSSTTPSITSPSAPANVNSIPANTLFKSNQCFASGSGSYRAYFTKISGDEFQMEADIFGGPNCELMTPPVVMIFSDKRVAKITGYSTSMAPDFQTLTLRQDYIAIMPLSQPYADAMASSYTVNGPWVVAQYHNMSGETNFPVNGTLSSSEIKFVGGLLTFSGIVFQ